MKYINRDLKGTYCYIKKQLIFEIIKTLILFAMALGIFFIGLLTLHTRKSLWSVLAVLALLPACKSLVGVIMLARFRSLSAEDYNRYNGYTKGIPTLFENILTTSSRSFYVPVISVMAGNVIGYTLSGNDAKEIKGHLENVMKNAGHKATVMIFDDERSFANRCRDLYDKFSQEDDSSAYALLNTIKAVSL